MSVLELNAMNYIATKLSPEVLSYLGIKFNKKEKEDITYHEENVTATNKENIKVEVKTDNKKEKVNIKSYDKKSENDKITMQTRKTCPVKVLTKEEKNTIKAESKNVNADKEEQHRVNHLINYLTNAKVAFTKPNKMPTGLYEMNIIQANGSHVTISVDINGLLYSDEIKFFLGKILPGEEYIKPTIMMTDESITALVRGEQIPTKFFITEQLFTLNKVLDLQTLKEKDPKKRAKVFKTVAKAISDKDIYDGILKAANGEPYRFAFARYINENEFSIVSSKRNLSSNLTDDKLLTSKEIWIKIKDKDVKLTTKSCDK